MTQKMASATHRNYRSNVRKDPKLNAQEMAIQSRSLFGFLRACLHALKNSFQSLSHNPFSTCMTLAVIGIALALPAGLLVMLQNVETITHGWNQGARISLYMKGNVSQTQAQQIANGLQRDPNIGNIRFISPSKGLQEFTRYAGFQNVISQLKSNPLPSVIVVQPAKKVHSPLQIQQLLNTLQQIPQVDSAELDMQWVKRLYTFLDLGRRVVFALAILLAFGVVLIISNTIRLITENHRSEIEVMKLVGATDNFIRRPFLYTGILYGAIGAIIAMVLVDSFLSWLADPVMQLSDLYDSTFRLAGLSNGQTEWLLVIGIALGFMGSWLAVSKHLRDFDPK